MSLQSCSPSNTALGYVNPVPVVPIYTCSLDVSEVKGSFLFVYRMKLPHRSLGTCSEWSTSRSAVTLCRKPQPFVHIMRRRVGENERCSAIYKAKISAFPPVRHQLYSFHEQLHNRPKLVLQLALLG